MRAISWTAIPEFAYDEQGCQALNAAGACEAQHLNSMQGLEALDFVVF
jgi:hypothetical protein